MVKCAECGVVLERVKVRRHYLVKHKEVYNRYMERKKAYKDGGKVYL